MQRRSPVLGAIDARQDPALPFREREKREKGCLGVDRDEHFRWRTCPLRRCLPRLQLLDDGARNFVGDVGITSGDVLLFLFPWRTSLVVIGGVVLGVGGLFGLRYVVDTTMQRRRGATEVLRLPL